MTNGSGTIHGTRFPPGDIVEHRTPGAPEEKPGGAPIPLEAEDLEPHRAACVRTLIALGHAASDADDCAQVALLRVWARSREVALDRARLGNYLLKAAIREGLSIRRTSRRRREGLSLDAPMSQGSEATFAETVADPRDPFGEIVGGYALSGAVAAMLSSLPGIHREVLALDAEDLSQEEIAARLDLSLGTVKSRLSRARSRMRAMFGDELALLLHP